MTRELLDPGSWGTAPEALVTTTEEGPSRYQALTWRTALGKGGVSPCYRESNMEGGPA